MKHLLAGAALLLLASPAWAQCPPRCPPPPNPEPQPGAWTGTDPTWGPYPFAEGSVVGVPKDNPDWNRVIFINTTVPQYTPSPGLWTPINWAQLGVPADAKAAFVGGMLIITHGNAQQTCNETITFAAPNSTIDPGFYIFQTIEATFGGGQRQTAFAVVPIVNGQTWWMWRRGDVNEYPTSDIGSYPSRCAYAVNLSVEGYVR